VIDRELQEFNNGFTEMGSKLLICVASKNQRDSFSKLLKEVSLLWNMWRMNCATG